MAFAINEFKSQLVGGGARPSLFEVQISNPITPIADFKTPFMIYAAALPSAPLQFFEVGYFGRRLKYAGETVFPEWTVEVYNDEDFLVRNAMEAWKNSMNTHTTNLHTYPQQYKSQAQVVQYGKNGTRLREYTFEGLFPTEISPISLSWESEGIERYSITFQYDLWRVSGGITGISTS